MPIPQRVKDAALEAEQQLQQLLTPADPTPAPAPTPADPTPAPAPTDPAPTPPAPPAPTVKPTNAETELQRLQQQRMSDAGRIAAQEAEMAELRGRLSQLTEQLRAPAPTPPAPTSLITDADRSDFGEDMIDFVQRVFRQSIGDKLDRTLTRLAAIENQLRQVGQQAQFAQKSADEIAYEKYVADLEGMVPGWRETNDDPGFVDWLKKRDTFSRKIRHELLKSAHAAADAPTVAEFFRAYWKETGVTPAAPAPTPAPASAPATPTVDPASLVAPAPSSAPAPSLNPRGGKIWTKAEIEQLYDDRIKKRITAEAFAQREQEVAQAMLDGRVQM